MSGYRASDSLRRLPRGTTAILVIDPVNDFLSEGGAAWDLTKRTVEMNDVVANLERLIAGARERGAPVIFGPMAYTKEDYERDLWHMRSGINRIMFERKMFLAGSWGADFHPRLKPREGEVILQPHKGSDVLMTDLPQHLERLGTTHLVIAGMTANLCCESTGRHATEAGYDVTFVSNAMGSESLPSYEAAIHINLPLISNAVMEVEDVLRALDADPRAPQEGDKVFGSDRGEIGEVAKVVEGSYEAPAHMVVPRGILRDDLYIPLDAVTSLADGHVIVNVPKLVVGKMPWTAAPTRQAQAEKLGPAREQVSALYKSTGPTTSSPSLR